MIVYNTTECLQYPGFYLLQNFPNYCINILGQVININTGANVSIRTTPPGKKNIKGGYVVYHLTNLHNTKVSVGRHQLLCQTFKPKPPLDKKYIVNHLNGIPGDDRLENLEWVTYSENTQHAYDIGLYPNKVRRVLVRFMRDDSVTEYKSIAHAARALKVSEDLIRTRLKKHPGRYYNDGFAFKLHKHTAWSNEKPLSALTYRSFKARNIIDGTIFIFDTVTDAEKLLDIRDSCIILSLKTPGSLLKGYEFKLNTDHRPWRILNSEQIRTHLKYPHGKYPLKILLNDITSGVVTEFDDAREASLFLGKSRGHINKIAKIGGYIGNYKITCVKIL